MDEQLERAKLTLMMDGGWDQRASGKAYNSASRCHLSVGGRTNKVCALIYYSKWCSKCEKGNPHPNNLCGNPDNYAKLSRAMESLGAVETVLEIWNTCTNAYVSTIVTDKDSTTRSKLSHSMADLVAAGRMTEGERRYAPKKEGRLGPKKDDHGMLPLVHPEVEKNSNPIQFCKNYKSEHYVWVHVSKANRQLYLELGLKMASITKAFYKQQDKRRETDQAYGNKPERRKLRAQQRLVNINKEWQKEVIDKQNGNTYQSAMMAPSVAVPSSSETPRTSKGAVENKGVNNSVIVKCQVCKACQNYGHQRRSSRLCPKNKKSKYYEGKTLNSTES
jgi:hypothetical protein